MKHLDIFVKINLNFQKKKFDAYSSDNDDEDDKDESLTTEDDGSNDADSEDCE